MPLKNSCFLSKQGWSSQNRANKWLTRSLKILGGLRITRRLLRIMKVYAAPEKSFSNLREGG
jgi:hypothetical protein